MVDTAQPIDDAFAAAMAAQGVQTVARYYDYHPATTGRSTPPDEPEPANRRETLPGKTLRPEEVAIATRHGLALLTVFQHHNDREATFTLRPSRGFTDARRALDLAAALGQPDGSAIYFGVDGDFVGGAAGLDQDVEVYFAAIESVFWASGRDLRIGVYGSGAACRMLIEAGLAQHCWLSQSHGFPGTRDALAAGRYDIEQMLFGTCAGRPVDFNAIRPGVTDYGQWRP